MTQSKAVLVTGGAGYIGSHTCKRLAEAGYVPVAYDNLSTGHADAVRWGPLIEGDTRDREAVAHAIRTHAPVAVIHFAAAAYVGDSVRDPEFYYSNNVGGMLGLLTACRETGLARVIFSSSCATYGVPDRLPITEDTPQNPINPYGRTKLIGEWMLADFARAHGLRYVALRYFNACGADPDGTLCERHDPETHLVPLALFAADGRRPALDLFGTDYPTPDGTCIRDYIHVCDLAEGHLAALRHLEAGGSSLSVNLGTGTGHSNREVLDAVGRVLGRPVPVNAVDRREGDPPALVADPAFAREALGFAAGFRDLDAIVAHAARAFGMKLGDDATP
ncbi:UDP-glucose 4-epimerase GalE [Rhodovulum euryhalinum]|uniref:UDP-glucose 4-epimerase n=1 Tax=Rhodovulum euryhalinum TaxID=35805 RepID=A0A4R2KT36_9RHOB|nr:UDP-glucose 4-epimerase GalE [Rhodovulum euryhalinum]TCO73338.1 UDP-L-arabinose 4-epimerase [Rhodovulum euryhalinum]